MENDFEEELIYLRKNGENVSDPDIIAYCKLEQNRDIIENARLGSYDKYGNYIFMPQIRLELINIPKFIYHITKLENKKIFDIKTIIPIFGELFFKLTISDKEAVLYLVETVSRESGGYLEVYEEVVDAIVLGKMNPLLTEDIFSMYHIYENDTDEDKKTFFIYDYINLLTRKIYLTLLSKELNDEMQNDEHEIFSTMIAFLKDGDEYGEKVLSEFMVRLKDRPEIFEMENTEKYNKAVNEVLLSALDIVTTQTDKENPKSREVYLKVINARNKNVEKYIENAHKNVEKEYVEDVAKRAIIDFNEEEAKRENVITTDKTDVFEGENNEKINERLKNKEVVKEFYDKLVIKQKPIEKHIAEKAVLKKQNEENKSRNVIGALVGSKLVADKFVGSTAKGALNIVKGEGKSLSAEKSSSVGKKSQAETEEKLEAKSSSSSNASGGSPRKKGASSSPKSGAKLSSSSKKEGKKSGKKGASASSNTSGGSSRENSASSASKTAGRSSGKNNSSSPEKKVNKRSSKQGSNGAVNSNANNKLAEKNNQGKEKSPVNNLKKQEEPKKSKNSFPLMNNSSIGNSSKYDFESTPSPSAAGSVSPATEKATTTAGTQSFAEKITSDLSYNRKETPATSIATTQKETATEKSNVQKESLATSSASIRKETFLDKATLNLANKSFEKTSPTPQNEKIFDNNMNKSFNINVCNFFEIDKKDKGESFQDKGDIIHKENDVIEKTTNKQNDVLNKASVDKEKSDNSNYKIIKEDFEDLNQ